MLADGTLELSLRATDGKGMVGDALLKLAPGDKDYDMWLRHLGGMNPGEEKFIPPFPETLQPRSAGPDFEPFQSRSVTGSRRPQAA